MAIIYLQEENVYNFDGMMIRPVEILLVEDNPADIRLTTEALKDARLVNNVALVKDGVEALAFLRREGEYRDAVTPDLILMDLNLPKKNGLEVLAEIKEDDELKRIPVVVLTSSKSDQDIIETYNMHCNCYIIKPVDVNDFVEIVKSIENFWLSIVKLPPNFEQTC